MSDTIRAEITEEGGIKMASGNYEFGEVIVADSTKNPAKYADMQTAIQFGWARNTETDDQGERKPGAHRLDPAPIVQV